MSKIKSVRFGRVHRRIATRLAQQQAAQKLQVDSEAERKVELIKQLLADPGFVATGKDVTAQADIILSGKGDCQLCSGWGCSGCGWSGNY